MLVQYKRKANIAAAIWLGSLVLLVMLLPSAKGNMWETGDVPRISIFLVFAATYWYAFWSFAKAKGYSGFLGIILPLLSVLGLIILSVLRDKYPEPASDVGVTKLADSTHALDEKLLELKRLNDSGLISQEIYLERQRKLLEAS